MGKKKISIYLDEALLETLDAIAQQEALNRTQVISSYLETITQNRAESTAIDLLIPKLEASLKKEASTISHKLSALLRRTALEAATTRSLIHNEVAHQVGESTAKDLHAKAYKDAVDRLKESVKAWDDR